MRYAPFSIFIYGYRFENLQHIKEDSIEGNSRKIGKFSYISYISLKQSNQSKTQIPPNTQIYDLQILCKGGLKYVVLKPILWLRTKQMVAVI